jgi:hypothetical protein
MRPRRRPITLATLSKDKFLFSLNQYTATRQPVKEFRDSGVAMKSDIENVENTMDADAADRTQQRRGVIAADVVADIGRQVEEREMVFKRRLRAARISKYVPPVFPQVVSDYPPFLGIVEPKELLA